jgi:hypothetical protein
MIKPYLPDVKHPVNFCYKLSNIKDIGHFKIYPMSFNYKTKIVSFPLRNY